jgi:hypothetical protein
MQQCRRQSMYRPHRSRVSRPENVMFESEQAHYGVNIKWPVRDRVAWAINTGNKSATLRPPSITYGDNEVKACTACIDHCTLYFHTRSLESHHLSYTERRRIANWPERKLILCLSLCSRLDKEAGMGSPSSRTKSVKIRVRLFCAPAVAETTDTSLLTMLCGAFSSPYGIYVVLETL